MSYPQQFSSELTYESRYDLDQLDVFIEGDLNILSNTPSRVDHLRFK